MAEESSENLAELGWVIKSRKSILNFKTIPFSLFVFNPRMWRAFFLYGMIIVKK